MADGRRHKPRTVNRQLIIKQVELIVNGDILKYKLLNNNSLNRKHSKTTKLGQGNSIRPAS